MKYTITALLCAASLIACGGRSNTAHKRTQERKKTSITRVETVAKYGYRIVKSYPHDTAAYTQGLFWHDGFLYESTGEYGRSSLRKVVLETGKPIQQVALDDKYFGEGATLLNDKVYQLSWLEEKAFVYDIASLKTIGEFNYSGEGWGITTDGVKLYISNGTPNIMIVDPETFKTERIIQVRNGSAPVQEVNELEWIEGKIWANLYLSDYREMTSPKVIMIDPESGNVEGIIDFSGIYSELIVTRSTDVMNGIAYDPANGRIFVTGKRWNKLFEVDILKK